MYKLACECSLQVVIAERDEARRLAEYYREYSYESGAPIYKDGGDRFPWEVLDEK